MEKRAQSRGSSGAVVSGRPAPTRCGDLAESSNGGRRGMSGGAQRLGKFVAEGGDAGVSGVAALFVQDCTLSGLDVPGDARWPP